MRLLSIIEDTSLAPVRTLKETAIEKIKSGQQLSEDEAGLVLASLSESDPFSNHGTSLLSDEDLQKLGVTREDVQPASFDAGGKTTHDVVDPFNLDSENHEEQPGVSVGSVPDDLGFGSEVPVQEVPETVINMNAHMDEPLSEIPGLPGYVPPGRDQSQPAVTPEHQSQGSANPDEDNEVKPFPRRRPTATDPAAPRQPQPRRESHAPSADGLGSLMEGLGGMKKLQRLRNEGRRNNMSPEAVASLITGAL